MKKISKFEIRNLNLCEKGFTLIELLVSVAVLAVLSTSVFLGYSSVSKNTELKTATFKVLDILNLARSRTIASLATSSYGVHFEQFQYVLFKGTAYDAGDANNIFYALPASAEVATIALSGGGSEVIFDRLTGKTSQSGSIVVRLLSDITKSKTITILSSGRSDIIESALNPSGTARIADTRHVHFTYEQSIASITNMVLNFPNDIVTQNVNFLSYYNAGVFDWSGTVMVGGSPQVLRVHTNANTGASADFSVTRDLRYNTVAKRLEISLDLENVLNYNAIDGVATTTSFLVSNLQVQ